MKRLILAIVIVALLLSAGVDALCMEAFAQNTSALLEKDAGLSFSDEYTYESVKRMDVLPHTFEVWVNLNSEVKQIGGVIFGNGRNVVSNNQKANFNLKIETVDGKDYPAVVWKGQTPYLDETESGEYFYPDGEIVLENAEIPNDAWVHLAIVFSEEWNKVSCYLDGELADEKEVTENIFMRSITDLPFVLGGMQHKQKETYFNGGAIQDLTIYADSRTGDEIRIDMQRVDLNDEDLILHYDIDSGDLGKNIVDESGNGYDQYYNKMWLTEAEMEQLRKEKGLGTDRAYSIAVIGDTQKTTWYYPEQLPVLYQWLVDNREAQKLAYVIGVGDITDTNVEKEWAIAKAAITLMDGKVEYSLVRGNHDLKDGNNFLQKYFGDHEPYVEQFKEQGGFYKEGDISNTYRTLRIGKTDWLLINLDYGPEKAVLDWACGVVEKHPDHKVIISTHAYMEYDSTTLDAGDLVPVARPSVQNNGDEIWAKLVSQYENIKLMLCGHVHSDNILTVQEKGVHGNTVTQMLVDFQTRDQAMEGLGMITMLHFNEEGTEFELECYSAVKDRYFKNCNQRIVDLEEPCDTFASYWDGARYYPPKGSGTKEDPYQIVSAANLCWMADELYIHKGFGRIGVPTKESETLNVFEGMYFVQLADIDLTGNLLPAIGNYYENGQIYSAFSGNYDGGGFAIRNGVIVSRVKDPEGTGICGTGLFGVVSGATVRNLRLEGITVRGEDAVGALVGAVCADGEGTPTLIENCTVSDSCTVLLRSVGENANVGCTGGLVGGIFGMENAPSQTNIRNCVNNAAIAVEESVTKPVYAGGLVGMVKDLRVNQEVTLQNCRNTGGMTRQSEKVFSAGFVGLITNEADASAETASSVALQQCKNETVLPICNVVSMNYDAQPLLKSEHKWNKGTIADGGMTKNYHCEETGDQLTEILRPVVKAPLMEEGLPWIVGSAVVILLCVSAVAYLLVHSRKKN